MQTVKRCNIYVGRPRMCDCVYVCVCKSVKVSWWYIRIVESGRKTKEIIKVAVRTLDCYTRAAAVVAANITTYYNTLYVYTRNRVTAYTPETK